MQRLITPTLVIVIGASIVAGIALARPADSATPAPADSAEAQPAPAQDAVSEAPGGFLGEDAVAERGFLAGGATAAEGASQDEATAPTAAPARIEIADFGFGTPVTAAPGQTVDVSNLDGAPHTVTAAGASFDTGTIGGGAEGSFIAPDAPGTYQFFCAIHPSMQGELIVQG